MHQNRAEEGLHEVEQAAADARIAADNAGIAVQRAITDILLSELEPCLAALEVAHSEYMLALEQAQALHSIMSAGGRGGPLHPYFEHRSTTGAEAIAQRLAACAITPFDETALRPIAGRWISFARRLIGDPNAAP